MRSFRIAMAQMNPVVGDLPGNVRRIERWIAEARKAKADLVAFPELAITGYPPEDLLLKPRFLTDVQRALDEVVKQCRGIAAVVGFVDIGGRPAASGGGHSAIVPAGGQELYNAAAVVADRRLAAVYGKRYLPNYGVFDESRYFHPGRRMPLVVLNGTTIGVSICEDIWFPEGPVRTLAAAGAEVIVNINASPFHVGKTRLRERMLATRARDNGVIVTYTNTVGGQDELVFDGSSLVLDQEGEVLLRGPAFREDLLIADLDVAAVARARMGRGRKTLGKAAGAVERVVVSDRYVAKRRTRWVPDTALPLDPAEEVYRALVLGVQDYVRKNGFRETVIGLSGGVDSALTAVIAADALGADNVLGVFMPSPYTSRESREDVIELSRRLGIRLRTIPITATFRSYLRHLAPLFKGQRPNIAEENLQARIRGNLLMALSNKFGSLVLTTGNKSEMSVGYATLYGDMAGGFAVIKDVPKTMVYDLSRWRNRQGGDGAGVIPKRVLDRPPTAELAPNQKDEDTLPPYAVLDPILKAYIEEDRSAEEIAALGFEAATVKRVIAMVDRSEYKRRQAPIGIKITHRAFGKDRRMPVTNGYRSI